MATPLTYTTTSSAADYEKMLKVGFSPAQARFLTTVEDWSDADARKLYRHAFSSYQWKVLTSGGLTLKRLLTEGKFTRHQAKLILAANA